MQESLDRIVSCICYYNPDCFYCGGSGVILESLKIRIAFKRNLKMLSKEESFVKSKGTEINFYKKSDTILPERVAFIIKEFKYTGDPKERVIFTRLRTMKGTVDYALGTSINNLVNAVEDIYASKYFKNKQFHIDIVIESISEPLNKIYNKNNPLLLMNDIINYLKNKFA